MSQAAKTVRAIVAVVVTVFVGTATASAQHAWLGASGQPLPFANDDAIIEFLASAEIVDEKPIGVGVNQSVKLTLERDGVRAHAIFREADIREDTAAIAGVSYRFFADSYLFECAAYELARLIDLPLIPPVTLRRIARRQGSIQMWLEDSLDEDAETFRPPKPLAWVRQIWDMKFLDNLIYNIDRNPGNILVDSDYQLWLIDHTRAFQFRHELLDDDLTKVPQESWEKLVALSDDELEAALRDFLTPREVKSLLERRKTMIAHVEALVAERSPAVVFY